MSWTVTTPTLIVLGSGLLAMGVGIGALRQRPDPLAWPLAVTMFAVAAWAIPHAVSFGYASVEQVTFWHRVRYPGTVVAPVGYLVMTLTYAEYDRWLTRRTYAALAVVPAVTIVLVWTNPAHELFWQSVSITRVSGASVLVEEYGPWYWVNLGYLYLITVASLGVLGDMAVRSGRLYRKQAGLLFVGGVVPFVTNGVINFEVGPTLAIDFTTTALTVSGITFALALFHFDLLELRPVARDRLIEELDDGVVVIGPDGRIRDFNPVAAHVLGDLTVDQDASEVLPSDVAADGGELVAEADGEERRFRMRTTALTDDRGREIGRLVALNDITELVEREQRVSVLNRILRHNIRNELNVVAEYLTVLEGRSSGEEREYAETAKASTRQVIDFAEKARLVERTLRRRETTVTVPVGDAVERVLAEGRERYPDAILTAEQPTDGEVSVRVVDEELFELALSELLENAIVHNDRPQPQATVRVEAAPEEVRVSVADDGPGVPEHETDIATTQIETQLDHTGGLGLWLVRWVVGLSAGDLSFGENDPRGSVVTIALPRADATRRDHE